MQGGGKKKERMQNKEQSNTLFTFQNKKKKNLIVLCINLWYENITEVMKMQRKPLSCAVRR